MDRLAVFLTKINRWIGTIVRWLIIVLIVMLIYDVIMRYVFNMPTIWAFDMGNMIGGSFFVLGISYAAVHKQHIRVDILYNRLPERAKGWLDIVLTLIFFYPTFGILLYKSIPNMIYSWRVKEKSLESFWQPPIYPVKTILVFSIILLVLQVTVDFIKSVNIVTGRSGNNELS